MLKFRTYPEREHAIILTGFFFFLLPRSWSRSWMNLERILYCYFRKRSWAGSRKILKRILTKLEKVLKTEMARIWDRILIKSWPDPSNSGSWLIRPGFLQEWSGLRLGDGARITALLIALWYMLEHARAQTELKENGEHYVSPRRAPEGYDERKNTAIFFKAWSNVSYLFQLYCF